MTMKPITHLTIHCAATPEGRANTADEVREWDIKRFGQPSYHHVIELTGKVFTHLSDDERGAHVGGHNSHNIGVCYVGGMDAAMRKPKDTRTGPQRAAMLKIVQEYRARYPGLIVLGHRDWHGVGKACPSFSVKSWLTAEGMIR